MSENVSETDGQNKQDTPGGRTCGSILHTFDARTVYVSA